MAICNEPLDIIYNLLKKYIQESLNETSSPSCDVKTQSQSTISRNLIVLEEIDNRISLSTTRREETISGISFEVNIYCPNDATVTDDNGETIIVSRMEQARELRKLVDEVLGDYYKLNRNFCQPTPNLDTSIYRITMRYSGRINDNKLKIMI